MGKNPAFFEEFAEGCGQVFSVGSKEEGSFDGGEIGAVFEGVDCEGSEGGWEDDGGEAPAVCKLQHLDGDNGRGR